ncbi:type II secretion system ATPase GspE [Pseudoteredinibacter isoporae]
MGSRDERLCIFYAEPIQASVYSELCRFFRQVLPIEEVELSKFSELMAQTYEASSSASREVMDEIDADQSLASLQESMREAEDLLEQEDEAPIVRLINAILAEAIQKSASDIHLEVYEKSLCVRFRVDGVLNEVARPKRELASLLTSRVKVMAGLDIAEKRVPQDGRISLRLGGREIDVRVSTLPSVHGERLVMRLLDKQSGRMDLSSLGLSPLVKSNLLDLLQFPHGIVLVTGPTGSGKSTTLYAGLTTINHKEKNILTVEDPVEFHVQGIGQTQVNEKAGMSFAKGLRAILRQDPDVVMVGEIRDIETMKIAVQASLTGHLVLSTLHTNSAVGAVTRLMDMGVEPFLLSSSLLAVLAQRLVRRLCLNCRETYTPDTSELGRYDLVLKTGQTLYQASKSGCEACDHSGYRGRTGIYELIVVDQTIKQLIHDEAAERDILDYTRKTQVSMLHDGWEKVLSGETSLAEVLRVVQEI